MVFNTTFNNISVMLSRHFYWWRKLEYLEKTTDLLQVTDKPGIMVYIYTMIDIHVHIHCTSIIFHHHGCRCYKGQILWWIFKLLVCVNMLKLDTTWHILVCFMLDVNVGHNRICGMLNVNMLDTTYPCI